MWVNENTYTIMAHFEVEKDNYLCNFTLQPSTKEISNNLQKKGNEDSH
jgi:hypothetical protein